MSTTIRETIELVLDDYTVYRVIETDDTTGAIVKNTIRIAWNAGTERYNQVQTIEALRDQRDYFRTKRTDWPTIIANDGFYPRTTANGASAVDSATITVATTVQFASSGQLSINGGTPFNYTGKTATTFTGCGAHPALAGGEAITAPAQKLLTMHVLMNVLTAVANLCTLAGVAFDLPPLDFDADPT